MVNIGRAGVDDIEALAPLLDAYRQFYKQAADLSLAQTYLNDRLTKGQSVLLGAWDGEQAVGFAQLYPTFCTVRAAPIMVLYDLFVAPASRQRGWARALLAEAEVQGRLAGAVRLDLTTARDNHAAQSLYRRMGWIEDKVYLTFQRHLTPTQET